jgi:predicted transglutaminase-like cysteine proteinase
MTKLARTLFSILCAFTASSAFSQTVVGPDSAPGRYNRLRDLAVRPVDSVTPASPDVFGTAAVGAGVTFYDARFRRVSQADRNDPRVVAIADTLRGLAPAEQLAKVQSEVLGKVRWASDLDTMKVADFWANAGETLQRGAGDSEDIAIVEMQALKAAGFNPRDLYISIGRERQVGAHIVLLARTADGFTVLDDKIGHPMATRDDHIFTPVLTVGDGKSWIHGRRISGGGIRLSAR